MAQLEFDDKVVKQLEVLYGTRDVRRRRALVTDALAPAPGERILDVGCGPGFYAADLLGAVGPAGSVVGVDASEQMLAVAERRTAGLGNAAFRRADASGLPVADGEFDAALCVQVLEYVPEPTAALREMHRALRPGGRVVVWDVDWRCRERWAGSCARRASTMCTWRRMCSPLIASIRRPTVARWCRSSRTS